MNPPNGNDPTPPISRGDDEPTPPSQEYGRYTSGFWSSRLFGLDIVRPQSALGWSDTGIPHRGYFRNAFERETDTEEKKENFRKTMPLGIEYDEYKAITKGITKAEGATPSREQYEAHDSTLEFCIEESVKRQASADRFRE
ncbi:MAG: hypothetical protein M1839_006487 [Geoglossum umbratile]|nr:MAG: hypothetical protein M1839_006487 [Geoglossum umbratile]